MRTTFINTLTEFARRDPSIVLMTADLGFKIFDELREAIGPRFINAGVAEANMISVAAAMAMNGKKVYCYSMVPFLTMRTFEQIRVDVCSHNLPVRLVGIGAALGYPMEGTTHHALEDVAVMRALPNMTVVAPGDKREVEALIKRSVEFNGPLYVRLAKDSNDIAHATVPELQIGQSLWLKKSADVVLLSNGPMLTSCQELVERLAESGINVGLVSMPTVKPLDLPLLRSLLGTRAIFTVEEHSIMGGFGSAVAEELLELGYQGIFKRLGLPDAYFKEIGEMPFLRRAAGIDVPSLEQKILSALEQKSIATRKIANLN